jgi:hypothetical protein
MMPSFGLAARRSPRALTRNCMNKSTHQKLIEYCAYIVAGITFLGALLDTISNSIALITKSVTNIGTVALVAGGFGLDYYLQKHGLDWVTRDGRTIRIQRLEDKQIYIIIGLIVVLWIPRVFGDAATKDPTPPNPTQVAIKTASPEKDPSPEVTPERFILERDYEAVLGGPSNFRFHVIANSVEDTVNVEIYSKKSNKRFQVLTTNAKIVERFSLTDTTVIAEDMNFDGFEDFRVLLHYGGAGVQYECYTYHSGLEKFEFNENLSELLFWSSGDEFNSTRKELEVASDCGAYNETLTRVYRLNDNEFILDRAYKEIEGKRVLVHKDSTCDSYSEIEGEGDHGNSKE